MSGFLKRFTAFLLGMVFGIVALFGGAAFGVFWAYRNYRPLSGVEAPLGDLNQATIEELVDLVAKGIESPDEYTLKRLESEYGLDLASLLDYSGLKTDNVKDVDWEALKNVSILSIANGLEAFLSSVKVRALYVFLPAVTGMSMNELLSPEAQASIGEQTVWELVNSAEGSDEIGLLTAIKGLKIGALLPSVFSARYDDATDQFLYSVKSDSPLGILNLVSNVSFKAIIDVAEGADVIAEIKEGGLLCIGRMKISEVLDTVASVAGETVSAEIKKYTRAFENVAVKDLFLLNEAGSYEFTADALISSIEVGYLVGYEKTETDEWVDAEGNAPEGLLAALAKLNVGEVLNGEGDLLKAIEAVAGNLTLQDVFETFMPKEDIPNIVKKLGNITVSGVIGSGTDNILDRLLENLDYSLDGVTVGDALLDLLPDAATEFISSSALLNGLMNVNLGDFIEDKDGYTLDTFVVAFEKAIGDIRLGEAFGIDENNGEWECNEFLAILMDKKLGEFFDITRAKNVADVVNDVFGEVTFGDFFGAAFGYDNNNAFGVYQKDGEAVTTGFDENLLDIKLADVIVTITGTEQGKVLESLKALTLGDVFYSVTHALSVLDELTVYDGQKVFVNNELKNLSSIALNLSAGEVIENFNDLYFWKDLSEPIKVGDVLAILLNGFTPIKTEYDEAEKAWTVTSDVLKDSIAATLNLEMSDFYSGDWEAVVRKAFGGMTVGDIMRNFLPAELEDKTFIAATYDISIDGVLNIFESSGKRNTLYEYVQEVYDQVVLGDIVGVFYEEWREIGALNAFGSVTIPDTAAVLLGYKSITGVFGDITVGELVSDFIPDDFNNNETIQSVLSVTLGEIVKTVIDFDKNEFYDACAERLGDATLGSIVAIVYPEYESVGALNAFGKIKLIDYVAVALEKKSVEAVFGDVSLGNLVGDYVPESLTSNKFVLATEKIDVRLVIDCILDPSLKNIAAKAATLYDGVTFGDAFAMFNLGTPSDEGLAEIYAADIGKLFDCLATGETEYLETVARSSFEKLGKTPKIAVLAVAGVTGGILYFAANDKLVAIAESVFGKDAVWFDVVGSYLGYEKLENGEYYNGYVANTLGNKLMGAKVGETLTKGYPFVENFKADITLGNLATLVKAEAELLVKYIKADFVTDADGDIIVAGELEELSKVVLNFSLEELLAGDYSELKNEIKALTVGSFAAYPVARLFGAEKNENEFVVATYAATVGELWTLLNERNAKNTVEYFDALYSDVKLGAAVELVWAGWKDISPVKTLCSVKVADYIAVFLGERSVEAAVGNVSVGDLVESFVPDEYEENAFVQKTYGFTVKGVIDLVLAKTNAERYDYLRSVYGNLPLGSALDLFYKGWKDISPLKAFLDISITDYFAVLFGEKSVQAVFGNITVGGLTESFIKSDAVKETEIVKAVFGVAVNDVLDYLFGKTGLRSLVFDKFGELSLEDAVDLYDAFTGKDTDVVAKLPFAKTLAEKLLTIKLNAFENGVKNGAKETLETLSVGDAAAELVKKVADRLGAPQEYVLENGVYVVTGGFDVLMNDYYNITLYELASNVRNLGWIKGKVNKPLGAFLKDTLKIVNDKIPALELAEIAFDGTEYSASGAYAAIIGAVVNVTPSNVLSGLRASGMNYLFSELLGEVRFGHVVEGGKNVFEADVWYTADGIEYDFGDGAEGVLKKTMYTLTVKEITEGDAYTIVFDTVKTSLVGELMGYEKRADGWYDGETKLSGVIAKVADYTVNDLSDFNALTDDWLVGEVMGYEKVEGVWTNGGVAVEGVLKKLSDKKIGELGNFNEMIKDWTIKDVLGDAVDSNRVLKLVSNTPIGELSNGIDNITLGEVMGYTLTGGVWKNEAGETADGIIAALADMKIADVTAENLQTRVNAMEVKKLVPVTSDSVMNMLPDGTTVGNAAEAMQDAIKDATIGTMGEYGIIDLDAIIDTEDNVTVGGALTIIVGSDAWKNMTTSDLLIELVTAAYNAKKLTPGA